MIAGEGPPGAVRAVHARREADDQQPGVRIAERRHRLAEIVGLLRDRIERKARRAQRRQPGSKMLFMRCWGSRSPCRADEVREKTGYADLRVARRRSRLEFGLTRAQPNLRESRLLDPWPNRPSLRRRRYLGPRRPQRFLAFGQIIIVRSVQTAGPLHGPKTYRAQFKRAGKFATQDSTCAAAGNRSFQKAATWRFIQFLVNYYNNLIML